MTKYSFFLFGLSLLPSSVTHSPSVTLRLSPSCLPTRSLFPFSVLAFNQQLFLCFSWTGSCIIKPPLKRQLFSLRAVDSSRAGCSRGRQEWDSELWRRERVFFWCEHQGESRLCQISKGCASWWDCRRCVRSRFFPPHLPHSQQACTHGRWCCVYCGPGKAVLAESAERGKQKQGGRGKKKINSHRHATLHQDCSCRERKGRQKERQAGMERQSHCQREIGDWKET